MFTGVVDVVVAVVVDVEAAAATGVAAAVDVDGGGEGDYLLIPKAVADSVAQRTKQTKKRVNKDA